jgi:hypothetical protein
MEFQSIDASAKLAKRELIERTCNAAVAAVLAARMAHPPLIDDEDKVTPEEIWGAPEPVPAPVPAHPVPVPRRPRKRPLATVLKAARKAGADHVIADGVKIALSPAAAVPTESNRNAFDQWKAKHAR